MNGIDENDKRQHIAKDEHSNPQHSKWEIFFSHSSHASVPVHLKDGYSIFICNFSWCQLLYCCIQYLDIGKAEEGPKSINKRGPNVQLTSETSMTISKWFPQDNYELAATAVQLHQCVQYNYDSQGVCSYEVVQCYDMEHVHVRMNTKMTIHWPKKVQVPYSTQSYYDVSSIGKVYIHCHHDDGHG